MKKPRQNNVVKVRRSLYPHYLVLLEVVSMLTALGYTVKVI